jgi:hypothetical protein
MTELNPYAPPVEEAAPPPPAVTGDFLPDGRVVSTGQALRWVPIAFAAFRRDWVAWVLIFGVLGVAYLVAIVIPIVGPLVVGLGMPIVSGGLLMGCAASARGEKLRVGHVVAAFGHHAMRLVGLGLVYLVASTLTTGPILWMWASGPKVGTPPTPEITPLILGLGLVMTVAWVPMQATSWFAMAQIVEGRPVFSSLRSGALGAFKNLGPLFVQWLLTIAMYVVAAMTCMVGMPVFIAIVLTCTYLAYRDIFFSPVEAAG